MGRKSKRFKNSKQLTATKSGNEYLTYSNLEVNENRDATKLLTIFPEEVWLMILVDETRAKSKAVTDSLTNCSLASLYFRKLLRNQRKFFLFPKVLDCLSTWVGNGKRKVVPSDDSSSSDDDDDHSDEDRSSDDSCDEIERSTAKSVFKLTDILKCREVCPEWNQGFQHLYQDVKRYTSIQHDQNEPTRNLGGIKMSMRESNPDRGPSSFLSHFERTHGGDGISSKGNPFPGRSIILKDVNLGPAEALGRHQVMVRSAMSTILEKYGENLWHCCLDLQDQNYTNRIAFYRKLREWLSFMPNLKTLKLNCTQVFRMDPEREELNETLDELHAEINRHPLPAEMKTLQYLSVNSLAPAKIFNELVRRYGRGLAQLVIIRGNGDGNPVNYDIYSEGQTLLNLKELSINFQSVEQFEQMDNCVMAANWNLEKFYCLYDRRADFVEWSRVFQMISNKWSGSLNNLVLQMPVAKNDKDKSLGLEASLSSTSLQLSNIKRFKLIVKSPCSLDFLLPSSSTLESIEIIADYNVDEEKGKEYYKLVKRQQQVKLLGFEKSKLKFTSNIFEKFPKLKILQIVSPLGQPKEGDVEFSFRQRYRFSIYKEGVMQSEDREECPWDISKTGLLI